MIRFMLGLSIACLIAGCGDSADSGTEEKKDASTNAATTTVADSTDAANTAATEEPAQETKEAELTTVKFKVPGMT